jgi:hypothetical protein
MNDSNYTLLQNHKLYNFIIKCSRIILAVFTTSRQNVKLLGADK